jgi:hypothetical protein
MNQLARTLAPAKALQAANTDTIVTSAVYDLPGIQ